MIASIISGSLHSGDLLDPLWANWFFGTEGATIETVYKGTQTRAERYLGTRTDAELYLGALDLFP